MRIALGQFAAPSPALVATNQAQPTVRWKAAGVFWRRLGQNVIPRVHFGTLKVDKIDAETIWKMKTKSTDN